VKKPTTSSIAQKDTHRLIPSKYGDSVLERISEDDEHLLDLFELEGATNDRLLGENNLLPGIRPLELVYGFQHYNIVNAAFCHARPGGSRFNGSERGAWYAAFERDGSVAEVAYHKTQELWEISYFHDEVEYDDLLADFTENFHDLRDQSSFTDYLNPSSYIASQTLAAELLVSGSPGIVYPRVRYGEGTNLVCFRPALVHNVRRDGTCQLTWDGNEEYSVSWV